jgi:hypothetical protein
LKEKDVVKGEQLSVHEIKDLFQRVYQVFSDTTEASKGFTNSLLIAAHLFSIAQFHQTNVEFVCSQTSITITSIDRRSREVASNHSA